MLMSVRLDPMTEISSQRTINRLQGFNQRSWEALKQGVTEELSNKIDQREVMTSMLMSVGLDPKTEIIIQRTTNRLQGFNQRSREALKQGMTEELSKVKEDPVAVVMIQDNGLGSRVR